MTDIKDLLERGAGDSPGGFSAADVEHRARQRTNRRQMMSGVALLFVLGLGLAAVATMTGDRDQPVATSTSHVTADDLIGGQWTLVEFNGQEVPSGDGVLEFGANGHGEGFAFCNGFIFSWSLTDGWLSLEAREMTYVACGGRDMALMGHLPGARVERVPGPGDSISLHRDDATAIYVRDREPDGEAQSLDDAVPDFEVVYTGVYRVAPIGRLGSATNDAELRELWEVLAFDGVAERGLGEVPLPEVDFERQVVVSITIPDDDCPPELVRFDVDGPVLTPVFEQPPGGCIEPSIPKVYVVALSHEFAPPGSVLRYPDDPELQQLREGPREIPIWPAADSEPETDPDADEEAEPARGDAATAEIHFTPEDFGGQDCRATSAATRPVPVDASVTLTAALTFALEELLAGPNDEERASGLTSWFSDETAGMLQSVDVSDGVAHISFQNFFPLLNNATTSCGGASLMSSLNRTVTQFPEIDKVVYYLDGEAAAFYGWLESTPPPEARPSP